MTPHPIYIDGVIYPSVENFYQSEKTLDFSLIIKIGYFILI